MILRERPEERRCRCHCQHCRIIFVTDPRNAGRQDLRCPFGCREAHRKQESTRRSVAYYQQKEGKLKKRALNGRRRRVKVEATEVDVPSEPEACVAEEAQALGVGDPSGSESAEPDHDESPAEVPCEPAEAGEEASRRPKVGHQWSKPLIEFVRVVTGLSEGRRVSRREAEQLLGEVLRQHSMAHWRRIDHFVAYLHQNPP